MKREIYTGKSWIDWALERIFDMAIEGDRIKYEDKKNVLGGATCDDYGFVKIAVGSKFKQIALIVDAKDLINAREEAVIARMVEQMILMVISNED